MSRSGHYRDLHAEMRDALMGDQSTVVSCPAYKAGELPAHEAAENVVCGDGLFPQMLLAIRDAAKGQDVELRCRMLIDLIACQHASEHEDADLMEGQHLSAAEARQADAWRAE